MKSIHIISGVLLFLLIAVSSASAATFYLTETSNDYSYGVPIKIQVDYTDHTMSLKVVEPQNKAYDGYTISNVDLKFIWIKTAFDKVSVPSPWEASANKGSIGNFGKFDTEIKKPEQSDKSIGPVEIQLTDSVDTLIQNNGNYIVAAQVAFDKSGEGPKVIDCSGKVTGKAEIPEFPSMVLPVAAILGLLFISQRRKEN